LPLLAGGDLNAFTEQHDQCTLGCAIAAPGMLMDDRNRRSVSHQHTDSATSLMRNDNELPLMTFAAGCACQRGLFFGCFAVSEYSYDSQQPDVPYCLGQMFFNINYILHYKGQQAQLKSKMQTQNHNHTVWNSSTK